jgi:large subunit ribosomal protein L33
MAKGKKEARGIIKLVSSESSHCYFTEKNRNNTKERIQLMKYDPILRKRVMYKEAGKL